MCNVSVFLNISPTDLSISHGQCFGKSAENFIFIVSKAIKSCESAREAALDHFVEVTDMIIVGKGTNHGGLDEHL